MSPKASVKYFDEVSESYTDFNGVAIASQDVRLGRLSFGPEIGYRRAMASGRVLEPHLSIDGIWDFVRPDTFVIGDELVGVDQFRVKLAGGFLITDPSGLSLRAAMTYDGIGADDFEAIGGQLWFNVPFQ